MNETSKIMNPDRVLIKYKEKYYRLFSYEENSFDGSIYFIFKNSEKEYRISYHTSGQINYYLNFKKIKENYIESLLNIEKSTLFFVYSTQNIEKLELYNKNINLEKTYIIEAPDFSKGRLNISLIIAPKYDFFPKKTLGLEIKYNEKFSFQILINEHNNIPHHYEEQTFGFIPIKGVFDFPLLNKDLAVYQLHREYHEKNTPSIDKNLIIYSPKKNDNTYAILFSEKARKPDIRIKFKDSDLTIEIIESHRTYAKFKVKNKNGKYIRGNLAFEEIIIDADLRIPIP